MKGRIYLAHSILNNMDIRPGDIIEIKEFRKIASLLGIFHSISSARRYLNLLVDNKNIQKVAGIYYLNKVISE
jgi:hypothetical protein